jgi:hypothetical protein
LLLSVEPVFAKKDSAIKNDSGAILRFFEIALVLVRFNHVASRIVNAKQSIV